LKGLMRKTFLKHVINSMPLRNLNVAICDKTDQHSNWCEILNEKYNNAFLFHYLSLIVNLEECGVNIKALIDWIIRRRIGIIDILVETLDNIYLPNIRESSTCYFKICSIHVPLQSVMAKGILLLPWMSNL
jgi:hypothetical protein